MPGSIIGELILQPILEVVFHVVFYGIGRVIVPIVSFGRIKCDRMTADTPRRKLRGGGVFHRRGGQIYLTADMTAVAGILFVAVLVGAGFLIHYLTKP